MALATASIPCGTISRFCSWMRRWWKTRCWILALRFLLSASAASDVHRNESKSLTPSQQSSANWILKSVALVTLVAIVWVAVAPTAPGLLWALIVPVLLLLGEAAAAHRSDTEQYEVPVSPVFPVLSVRAPPSIPSLVS